MPTDAHPPRRGGRGLRPWLILVKQLGLTLFLGALAAMAAFIWLGPVPETDAGWRLVRAALKAVFWPCFFGGLVVTILAGLALFLLHPKVFLRMRWFRVKAIGLAVVVPVAHLWARNRALRFDAALEAGDLASLPVLWKALGSAFVYAWVLFLVLAAIARYKPRLGERVGARRGR